MGDGGHDGILGRIGYGCLVLGCRCCCAARICVRCRIICSGVCYGLLAWFLPPLFIINYELFSWEVL